MGNCLGSKQLNLLFDEDDAGDADAVDDADVVGSGRVARYGLSNIQGDDDVHGVGVCIIICCNSVGISKVVFRILIFLSMQLSFVTMISF